MKRVGGAVARGVSLVEAIVAMAVMAFGMIAIVGLQSSLRQNSEIAKQRSEAVRIAEEAIEQWRAFSIMGATSGASFGYGSIATPTNPQSIAPDATNKFNTTYTLQRTIGSFAPGLKSMRAEVTWVDRAGQAQSIVLNTIIAAADPALSGRLTMAPGGGAALPPQGRHPAIPVVADNRDNDRKSIFMPAGSGGGVLWVFDNLTGIIVGVCNTVATGQSQVTDADTLACDTATTAQGLALSGYVRFATDDPPIGSTKHSAAVAENPPNTALNLSVALTNLSSAGNANPTYSCYSNAPISYQTAQKEVAYHCAILFNANAPLVWSGMSELSPQPFTQGLPTPPPAYVPWALVSNANDGDATRYRICRYTPAASDADPVPNRLHPRQYTNVNATEPLTNQNFLVIRAGNVIGTSGSVFTCPTDVAADPANGDFVNSNTLAHQPPP